MWGTNADVPIPSPSSQLLFFNSCAHSEAHEPVKDRVGTIQYVYRSVSIPYSTPVSCMVSPSPNEDPVGTTKCPDSLVLRYI